MKKTVIVIGRAMLVALVLAIGLVIKPIGAIADLVGGICMSIRKRRNLTFGFWKAWQIDATKTVLSELWRYVKTGEMYNIEILLMCVIPEEYTEW